MPTEADFDAAEALWVEFLENASGNNYGTLQADPSIGMGFNSSYIEMLPAIAKMVTDLAKAFAGWLLGKLQQLSDCISQASNFINAGGCLFSIWRATL